MKRRIETGKKLLLAFIGLDGQNQEPVTSFTEEKQPMVSAYSYAGRKLYIKKNNWNKVIKDQGETRETKEEVDRKLEELGIKKGKESPKWKEW